MSMLRHCHHRHLPLAPRAALKIGIRLRPFSQSETRQQSTTNQQPSEGKSFLQKCSGTNQCPPPAPNVNEILFTGVLSSCGIGMLSLVHFGICDQSDLTMILGSFGASAVLLFAAPQAPLSQPRNVLGGHIMSCAIGVGCHEFISLPMGSPALAAALAVSGSIMLMQVTRSLHPPAGGTALIAVLGSPQLHALEFQLLLPTALGASTLVLIALGNNFRSDRQYPLYWW